MTDEKGRKVAVQIDLRKHKALWEDIEDVLISRSRQNEKRIPLAKVKARALAETPRPRGCKKLQGGEKEYRIRVGDYRIVYMIDDRAKAVDITRIAHRREVYD